METTPVKAIINGKKCVRVLDLAKAWGTSTATILATDKPHAVPAKYIHRLNGLVWCELEGLRQRAEATKNRKSSYISRKILEFLDGLEKPETTAPEPTDLGTAALIANARRTAAEALDRANEADTHAKANYRSIGKLGIRMYDVEADVYSLKHDPHRDHVAQSASATVVSDKNTGRIQELSDKLDGLADVVDDNQVEITNAKSFLNNLDHRTADTAAKAYAAHDLANTALDTAQQAADLAQKNADIITVTNDRLSLRLDRLSEHVNRVEKDAIASREDALQRIRQAERQQRDNAARIQTLEEYAHGLDWTLTAVTVLCVVGRVIRLLRRR